MERDLTNRANKVAKELSNWNRRYRSGQHRLAVPERLSQPYAPTRAYHDFERTISHDWQAKVHRAANMSMRPVLDRYFNGQAPFDTKGSKEFPDAIALLALEKWCAETQERIYVVSKDKAVLRAASKSPHLVGIESLHCLFTLVASAQDHDMADAVSAAFDEPQMLNELRYSLSESIDSVESLYDGDKHDVEVIAMAVVEVKEVDDVSILRVDQYQVACVAQVKLVVSAEIEYTDMTFATWDREDQRYYGEMLAVTEIQDTVAAKIIVELARERDEIALSSAQFLTQDLTVRDFFSDGYPYK